MLRLTKIELNGFKSFAAPTVIETGDMLLGVVGPNGAGKSNVLDAIHFVFGEQKPTVLRVSRLSDLIFSGSRTHGRLNLARVRLTFEFQGEDGEEGPAVLDEFGLVPLEEDDETVTYASAPYGSEVQELPDSGAPAVYDEEFESAGIGRLQPGDIITLSRKVYRDGLSEYQINGHTVRLSTVDKFFTRYQLGRLSAYSINQGEVEKKLLASPVEIRQWLGEATGVALLLRAKDTVSRKLARTRRNLTRVKDILGALGDEVERLELQAYDAERHQYLQSLRRKLAGTLLRGRLLKAAARREKVLEEERSYAGKRAQLEDDIVRRERELAESEQEAARLQERDRELKSGLNRLQEELGRLKIRESVEAERRRSLERQREECRERMETAAKRLSAIEEERAQAERKAAASDEEVESAAAELRSAEELLLREENSASWLRDEMAESAKSLHTLERELAVVSEKLETARHERRRREKELEEVKQKQAERRERLEALRSGRNQISLDFEAKEGELQEQVQRLAGLRAQHEQILDELRQAEKSLASVNERASYLAAMKSTYEALKEDFYSLEDAQDAGFALTPLLDLISFDEEISDAVELALGDVARAFVLSTESAGDLIVGEESLHGIFIAPDTAVDSVSGGHPWQSLWERMHGDRRVIAALRSALGEVALVEDAAEARSLLAQHPQLSGCLLRSALSLVTRGVIRKPGAPEGTLLFRKHAELPRVDEEIVSLAAQRETLSARIAELEQEGSRCARQIVHWDRAVRDLQEVSADLRSRLTQAESREEGLAGEHDKLSQELKEAARAISGLDETLERLGRQREELSAQIARQEKAAEKLRQQHEAVESGLKQRREKIKELEAARARLAAQREMAAAELARLERERSTLTAERAAQEKELAAAEEELRALAQSVKETAVELRQAEERLALLRQEAEAAAEELGDITAHREQLRAEMQTLVESRGRLESSGGAFQEKVWRAESELSEVIRELHRDLGVSLVTMMHELSEDTLRPAVQPADFFPVFGAGAHEAETETAPERESCELLDYSALSDREIRDELENVEKALVRLGQVNPLAPREYAEKRERLAFLTGQERDLLLAIEDMEAMLTRLEERTRQRFSRNLKLIETKFNELFIRLFGSGFARFKLTEPDDPASSGIEIEVQLPSSRKQSIKSLSGGERSLLFIALFLAAHSVRRGSFCVLDEVDAALDDVNVVRFCRLIQDLAQQEQFIIITHNKRTMRVLDRLVGVVTQPRGVSRIIEVTLRQAEGYAGRGAA